MPRRKPRKFDASKEIRAIARERVGTVKPSKTIQPKDRRAPKHKKAEPDQ